MIPVKELSQRLLLHGTYRSTGVFDCRFLFFDHLFNGSMCILLVFLYFVPLFAQIKGLLYQQSKRD